MDNTRTTPLPPHPPYNHLQHSQGGSWYVPFGASASEISQSQGPPFFDFSFPQTHASESHGVSDSMLRFQGEMMGSQDYFQGSETLPYRPSRSKTPSPAAKRSKKSPKKPQGEPSQKRRKTATLGVPYAHREASNPPEGCNSATGSVSSTCCSSCSDGLPCDDPQCAVPCAESSCEVPICNEPCIDAKGRLQEHQIPLDQGFVRSSERISFLHKSDSEPWNPVGSRASPPINGAVIDNLIDPTLTENDGNNQNTPGPASSSPPTPSMAHNMATPYSPHEPLQTTQFMGQHSQFIYPNETNVVLGAGTMFNPSMDIWGMQGFDNHNPDNESLLVSCLWNGCEQIFPQAQTLQHIHQEHLHPQMSFVCPMQSNECPPTIGSNHPLEHIQTQHSYNMGDGNYTCPAPTCSPAETYNDPAMFHNHFDQVHSTPIEGFLQCRLNSCNTSFADQYQFISHITESHQLPMPIPMKEPGNLGTRSESANYPSVIPDGELPGDVAIYSCKWKLGASHLCGAPFPTENALQEHVKAAHLGSLNKTTGYICQWEGCNRADKLGDAQGFSQRGKLERHLRSHTGYKCCQCDVCKQWFSAEQALRQHKLLHTDEKPWACRYCDKRFPQQSACTIHERIHTGEKPLVCPYPGCNRSFSESSNFAKHRKTHGETGKHVCTFPDCGKSFHRNDQLKKHLKTHYKNKIGDPQPSSEVSNTESVESSEAPMTPSADSNS